MAVRTVLFNIEALQDRLIAQRVKFAKRKHDAVILAGYTKDKSQPKKKNTKAQARFREDLRIFRKIMPSRRSWVHLDEKSRYGGKQNCRITSIDQNKKALELTFKRDCKNAAEYMLLQKNVLRGLRKQILRRKYEFSEPKISGTIKNKKELRPVCSFPIFDNIILQECNRILSTWFDPYFCASSYAFRVKYEHKKAPTHHDTILKILEYLSMHQGETIYVAECDLQKFFDTINHERIISCFANFLEQVPKPKSEKRMLEHLFFSYLRCYDYQKSVKPLNSNQEFLKKAKNRRFVWIKEELLLEKYGEAYSEQEIGVPQGGALSGLIANIVLHQVDYALEQLNDSDLLYLRFCDDMIMLHTNETDLNVAFSLYQEKLNENLLFIHEPKMIKDYSSQYYKVKSKAPFAFGPLDEGKIPWITFVGYDISHLKEVRVRKSTVEKQIKKQEEVVGKVIRTVKESERPIERKKM